MLTMSSFPFKMFGQCVSVYEPAAGSLAATQLWGQASGLPFGQPKSFGCFGEGHCWF
jgi:hypothetical protein